MIPLAKLARLPPSQGARKCLKLLTLFERELRQGRQVDLEYIGSLLNILAIAEGPGALDARYKERMSLARAELSIDPMRAVNLAKNDLLAFFGSPPSDWDFLDADPGETSHGEDPPGNGAREIASGVQVFLEELRSPYNVGSVFRTSESFGVEKILLSDFCAAPDHPRALRTGRGCAERIPWERKNLEDIDGDIPVFALELGGTPIDEFEFPKSGIVLVGSEELGLSPAALERARYGRVSIPLAGTKASINVSVAFGILMYSWWRFLRARRSERPSTRQSGSSTDPRTPIS